MNLSWISIRRNCFVIEKRRKIHARLYLFQRMYDYQFTNYIYIYRWATNQIRQISQLSPSFWHSFERIERLWSSTHKDISKVLLFLDQQRFLEKSWKSISFYLDNFPRYRHFYYYYYYTKHPRSIKFSVHFSTRARYIRRSHDWIPLHGSLPWNINWPKCHWESIIPGENSTSTFLCHKVAGNCYFQS